jgi:DNA-binding transcriptional ArsR family regulator
MKAQNVQATVRIDEKNSDFEAILRILDEECQKCNPLTPLECISRCKTWKLKNELRRLCKTMENPDFMKDLMNVLKNDTRLRILAMLTESHYSVQKLQQDLRMTGRSYSQNSIIEEYLHPLLKVGLAVEAQDRYYATTFGRRLTELNEASANMVNFLPPHSECNEETVLKALLSGPKTFEDINGLVSRKIVSRILRRLKKLDLVETPRERDYMYFFRSKRDPAKETFTSTTSKVYNNIPDEGISAKKLAQKIGLTTRTTYKYLKGLRRTKLVFKRKMPKAYFLTAKGAKLASLLNELYTMVEKTLRSFKRVFKSNDTQATKVAGVS